MTVDLHYGAASDVGRVRQLNEDSFLAEPPVFVVADGMGGHEGGEVASRIVVEEFARLVEDGFDPQAGPQAIAATLRSCQDRIHAFGEEQRGDDAVEWYAGTTAVVALVVEAEDGPKWLLANIGDSRIYRFTDGELDQVSVDHSVVQELMDAGVIGPGEAARHPERHVITRALGGPRLEEADFFLLPISAVERLLLCSDGVTGMIDDAEIGAILDEVADPRDAADRVVAAAVAAGGEDNATAVVVDVVGWAARQPSYDSEHTRVSLEEKLGALP